MMQGNEHGTFQETDAPVLEVGQCSAEVFRAVLKHIYTGLAAPSLGNVWDLTAAAEFYMLSGLQVSTPLSSLSVVSRRTSPDVPPLTCPQAGQRDGCSCCPCVLRTATTLKTRAGSYHHCSCLYVE